MARLEEKWHSEMEVAGQVRDLYQEIQALMETGDEPAGELPEKQARLKDLEAELEKRQAGEPLVQIAVDSETVSAVVSGWTGIPTGRMLTDEIDTVLNLSDRLKARIIARTTGWMPSNRSSRPPMPVLRILPSPPGFSCWWGPAASARPRRPWHCPNCFTAESRT